VTAHQLLLKADKWVGRWIFGFPHATISAICGSIRKSCLFCKVVCRVLHAFAPGHCEHAAQREGLAAANDEGAPAA
jgi:hypothetical protein